MSTNVSWQEALARLKEGNQRFQDDKLQHPKQDSARRGELTKSQDPFAIVLSCADSRIVPEVAFDTGLGELFVARVAGNVANTSTIASIEYAVAHLNAELIVVMGHEGCGAVGAALAGGDNGYNLNHLLCHLVPALEASPSREVNTVVKTNARLTSVELQERSKIIRESVAAGKTKIVPAYYNLGSGKVEFLEEEA